MVWGPSVPRAPEHLPWVHSAGISADRGARGALLYMRILAYAYTGLTQPLNSQQYINAVYTSCLRVVYRYRRLLRYKHTTTPEEPRGVDTHSQNHE